MSDSGRPHIVTEWGIGCKAGYGSYGRCRSFRLQEILDLDVISQRRTVSHL